MVFRELELIWHVSWLQMTFSVTLSVHNEVEDAQLFAINNC